MLAEALFAVTLAAAAQTAPPDPSDAPPPPIDTLDPAAKEAPTTTTPPATTTDPSDATPPAPPAEAPAAPAAEDEGLLGFTVPRGLDATSTGMVMFAMGAGLNCATLSCCFVGGAYAFPLVYCLGAPLGIGAAQTFVGNEVGTAEAGYLYPIITMFVGNAVTAAVASAVLLTGVAAANGFSNLGPNLPVLFGFAAGATTLFVAGTIGTAAASAAVYTYTSEPKQPPDPVVPAVPRADLPPTAREIDY